MPYCEEADNIYGLRLMRLRHYDYIQHWMATILFVLAASTPLEVLSAEDDTQQWSSVILKHAITPEVSANLTTRVRFDANISRKKDILVGPWVSIKGTDGMSLALGYDRIEPFLDSESYENRAWQQVGFEHTIFDIPLTQHFRLEERFIEDVDPAILRARYFIGLEIPIPDSRWYFSSSNEVFVNLNSDGDGERSGFDQNRLFFGPGRKLGEHLSVKFGYQWGHERRPGPNENIHAIVLSMALSD